MSALLQVALTIDLTPMALSPLEQVPFAGASPVTLSGVPQPRRRRCLISAGGLRSAQAVAAQVAGPRYNPATGKLRLTENRCARLTHSCAIPTGCSTSPDRWSLTAPGACLQARPGRRKRRAAVLPGQGVRAGGPGPCGRHHGWCVSYLRRAGQIRNHSRTHAAFSAASESRELNGRFNSLV